MQTTGLFESGDALRNVLFDLSLPIYSLIGVRKAHGRFAGHGPGVRRANRAGLGAGLRLAPEARGRPLREHYLRAGRRRARALPCWRRAAMTQQAGNLRPAACSVAALQVLADLCTADQIVVTNQGAARIWPKLRSRALDFHYNPSTMGGAIPLALGLALAQPGREVVAVSGDGSLLMSLGSLVSVVSAGAANLRSSCLTTAFTK
jgi:hypothetical protein